jgi:hypothetical protein
MKLVLCTDYENFVIDEPTTDVALYTFYVFNVTNAPDIYQRGNEPAVAEVTSN